MKSLFLTDMTLAILLTCNKLACEAVSFSRRTKIKQKRVKQSGERTSAPGVSRKSVEVGRESLRKGRV